MHIMNALMHSVSSSTATSYSFKKAKTGSKTSGDIDNRVSKACLINAFTYLNFIEVFRAAPVCKLFSSASKDPQLLQFQMTQENLRDVSKSEWPKKLLAYGKLKLSLSKALTEEAQKTSAFSQKEVFLFTPFKDGKYLTVHSSSVREWNPFAAKRHSVTLIDFTTTSEQQLGAISAASFALPYLYLARGTHLLQVWKNIRKKNGEKLVASLKLDNNQKVCRLKGFNQQLVFCFEQDKNFTVCLWDFEKNSRTQLCTSEALPLTLRVDDSEVVAAFRNNDAIIWNLTNQEMQKVKIDGLSHCKQLKCQKDQFVCLTKNDEIEVWDYRKATRRHKILNKVSCFATYGNILIIKDLKSNNLASLDLTTKTCTWLCTAFYEKPNSLECVAFDPENQSIALIQNCFLNTMDAGLAEATFHFWQL